MITISEASLSFMTGKRKKFLLVGIIGILGILLLLVSSTGFFSAPMHHVVMAYFISTVLLLVHILFGGYYLFSRFPDWNWFHAFLSLFIVEGLFLLAFSIHDPIHWFTSLIIVFFFASILHFSVSWKSQEVFLQEFCHFKMSVELIGIAQSVIGIAVVRFFPFLDPLLAWLTVLVILQINYTILFRRKMYSAVYPNPSSVSDAPKVSIIIPTFNEEDYILSLLESLNRQTYTNFEVIIVDDRSTDRTKKIIHSFHPSYPLRFVEKKGRRGTGISRNEGAYLANGELYFFLDADVELPEDCLRKTILEFRLREIDFAFVDFLTKATHLYDRLTVWVYRFWIKTVQYSNPRGVGFALLVKRDIHEKGGFDETVLLLEDFEYVLRHSHHGKFRILTFSPLYASWRRFENENRYLLSLKYLFMEFFRTTVGDIRNPIVRYEFGKYKLREQKVKSS